MAPSPPISDTGQRSDLISAYADLGGASSRELHNLHGVVLHRSGGDRDVLCPRGRLKVARVGELAKAVPPSPTGS